MDIAKIRKKIKEESEKGKEDKEKAQVENNSQQGESAEAEAILSSQGEEPVERPEDRPQETARPASQSEAREIRHEMPPQKILSPEPPIAFASDREVPPTPAKPAKTVEIITDIVELLTFHLSTEEFAFRLSDIEEILRFQQITIVPKVSDYILGITSLRGKIIPVIDLKKRLLITPSITPLPSPLAEERGLVNGGRGGLALDESRKKILILKGSRGPAGTLVDRVRGVIRISPSEIVEPPAHLTVVELMFIEGVVLHNSRFISVIRMEEVLNISLK